MAKTRGRIKRLEERGRLRSSNEDPQQTDIALFDLIANPKYEIALSVTFRRALVDKILCKKVLSGAAPTGPPRDEKANVVLSKRHEYP